MQNFHCFLNNGWFLMIRLLHFSLSFLVMANIAPIRATITPETITVVFSDCAASLSFFFSFFLLSSASARCFQNKQHNVVSNLALPVQIIWKKEKEKLQIHFYSKLILWELELLILKNCTTWLNRKQNQRNIWYRWFRSSAFPKVQ